MVHDPEENKQMHQMVDEEFKQVDEDGNGEVSLEELEARFGHEEHKHGPPQGHH